ncbi:MAG: hypothetical protein Q8P61_02995 [Candidatus Nanopelagicales bacterium]|nr:hypothetical protein [Candidatus Nanopelagicales bacterium]
MTGDQSIVLALAKSEWESDLILAIDQVLKGTTPGAGSSTAAPKAPSGLRVQRCVDVADLLVTADSGRAAVIVVDPTFPRLTAEVVGRLVARPVVVLAVCPGEQAERQARQLGFERVVQVGGGELVRAAAAVVAVAAWRLSGRTGAPEGVGHPERAGMADRLEIVDEVSPDLELTEDNGSSHGSKGRIIAVWGPAGAPGRTTIALALAHLAALRGTSTRIIDADLRTPGVAAAIGLEPESSGLAAAAALADRGSLTTYSLARQARQLGDRWRVLTGITNADRWSEVAPTGMPTVFKCATALDELVVVDVGSSLDREDDVLFDQLVPRRDAPAFYALAEADVVVAVGSCAPVGLARMLSSLPRLREATSAPVIPVVNRVRRSLGEFGSRRRLKELLDSVDLVDPALIPDDQAALDAATRRQLLPTESDLNSDFVRAVSSLLDQLGVSAVDLAAGY